MFLIFFCISQTGHHTTIPSRLSKAHIDENDNNKPVLTILTLDGGFLVLTQKPSLARVGWTGREKKKPRRSGQKPTWQPTMPHSQMLGTTVIKC